MVTSTSHTTLHVSAATPDCAAQWDRFVEAHPDASAYHAWAWRRVFERVFQHRGEYLAARLDGEIVGVLPLVVFDTWVFGRFAVSLPFVNYGGVLATTPEAARALLEAARGLASRDRLAHVELRHRLRRFEDLAPKRHKAAMLLPLAATADAVWNGFDRKVRNQIRKAEKSGLTAMIGGPELVGDFYGVFARNMRDLGTPVYTRRLFEEVLGQFPDRARVFLVRRGETTVAAGLSYAYRRTVEVPWASSLREYRDLCPNNLLYWTIIRHAIGEGATTLDFGRSSPEDGTFQFKRQWGAEPQPLCWEYALAAQADLPDQSPKNPKFRAAIAAWKRLPLGLATRLGPQIVRCIP
jgi:FemAB-related protein (PEP-CTERM system-associated)